MDKLLTTLLNKLGSGWMGYIGGAILLFAAVGLLADYVGQMIGMDPYPDKATTWEQVAFLFGNALAALGIRRKQSNQDEVILAAKSAAEEQTAASEELTEALESLPVKKK